MKECYINLTLVDQQRKCTDDGSNSEAKIPPSSSSPFSLEARLNNRTPFERDLIALPTHFNKLKQAHIIE